MLGGVAVWLGSTRWPESSEKLTKQAYLGQMEVGNGLYPRITGLALEPDWPGLNPNTIVYSGCVTLGCYSTSLCFSFLVY